MEQKIKENTVMNNQYVQQLTGNKKKATMAAVLIIVMIAMWIKVFVADSPGAAKAQNAATATSEQANEPVVKITFLELPDVNGRNNAISRDFFFMQPDNMKKVKDSIALNDQAEEHIKRIAGKLKLETIVMAENSQAFINGNLLSMGDVLTVKDGSKTYSCEVVEIKQNSVLMMCDREQIKLKLAARD